MSRKNESSSGVTPNREENLFPASECPSLHPLVCPFFLRLLSLFLCFSSSLHRDYLLILLNHRRRHTSSSTTTSSSCRDVFSVSLSLSPPPSLSPPSLPPSSALRPQLRTIDAGGDARKGDVLNIVVEGELEACAVA